MAFDIGPVEFDIGPALGRGICCRQLRASGGLAVSQTVCLTERGPRKQSGVPKRLGEVQACIEKVSWNSQASRATRSGNCL